MASGAGVNIDIAQKRFELLPEPLFEGLRFEVEPSSIVALIGPSGAGKSSLLRLVAGIDRQFEGSITVDGRPARDAETPGFVFQDPRLLPWLTASANILAVRPGLDRSRATELLREVGLAGFEDALPHQLSGGMQRRVAFARALALEPRLLLLDEPFVSLDKKLTHELHRAFLRLVATYEPTVIMVSHDADDAARLADRLLVIGGRPAKVMRDEPVEVPREQRTEAEIAEIIGRIGGDVEPEVDAEAPG